MQDPWVHLVMSLLHSYGALIYKWQDTGMRQSSMTICLIAALKDDLIMLVSSFQVFAIHKPCANIVILSTSN